MPGTVPDAKLETARLRNQGKRGQINRMSQSCDWCDGGRGKWGKAKAMIAVSVNADSCPSAPAIGNQAKII